MCCYIKLEVFFLQSAQCYEEKGSWIIQLFTRYKKKSHVLRKPFLSISEVRSDKTTIEFKRMCSCEAETPKPRNIRNLKEDLRKK